MDNIDLDYAKKREIKILNTPNPPSEAVAEMVISAALSLSRNIFSYNNDLHNAVWNKSISNSLKNKNIFLIGFGRIGRRVANNFSFFGSKISYFDPYVEDSDFEKVSLIEGLQKADIISIHSNAKNEIIGKDEFSKIKAGVIILNSSRGFHINEQELIKNLSSKKIKSCWLDVFENEPYEGELLKFSNAILTPHISTHTDTCREEKESESVKN